MKIISRRSFAETATKSLMLLRSQTSIIELYDKGQLSRRAYNVCARHKLENLEAINQHFEKHGDFTAFQNLGIKTNEDLIKLCSDFLLARDSQSENPRSNEVGESWLSKSRFPILEQFRDLDADRQEAAEKIYFGLKKNLSTRSQNILNRLSQDNSLHRLLIELEAIQFDFGKIQNVGQKTIDELKAFIKDLSGYLGQNSIEEYAQGGLLSKIKSELSIHVDYIDQKVLSYLTEHVQDWGRDTFPLLGLIDLLLQASGLVKDKYRTIIREYCGFYRSSEELSNEEIGNKLGLTTERVRQLFVNQKIHLRVFDDIQRLLDGLKNCGLIIPTYLTLKQSDLHTCRFESLNIVTSFSNQFLSRLLCVLNPHYQILVFSTNDGDTTLLLNSWVLERIDLLALFKRIEEVTNARVEETFEISVKGFITQFLKTDLAFGQLDRIYSVVERILFEFYGLSPDEDGCLQIQRNTKRLVWEYLYDILKEKNCSLHINEIADEMKKYGQSITATSVRSNLLRYDDKFMVTGSSKYGLREWEEGQRMIGGTIKQIIEKFLVDSEEPRHLYDIARHVMTYRNTTVHNVYSNMQSNPQNKFKLFGELFFGLSSKNYLEAALNYTSVSRHWFKEVEKLFHEQKVRTLPRAEILHYVVNLLGVKPVQIEYLLEERIKRGKLTLTDDQLLQLT